MNIVYYNGDFMPSEQATIPIMDRGFLYSDSIYETLPIERGSCFSLEDHLQRLNNNLENIHITPPLTNEQWHTICSKLITRNQLQKHRAFIYLHITRGAAKDRHLQIPKQITPTVLAFCGIVPKEQTQHYRDGYRVIVTEDTRRRDRFIKATGLLPNILAFEQAQQAGVDDVIFQHNGYALESTSSNLFIVRDETLITPPASYEIVNGITRQTVLKLAEQHHIKHEERPISLDELRAADEIWLTASNKDLVPVIQLNGQRIGNGSAGPMWLQFTLYLKLHKRKTTTALVTTEDNIQGYFDMSTQDTDNTSSQPMEFPCEFFIKIITKNSGDSEQQITSIIQRHFKDFDNTELTQRPSKKDNYMAFTAKIQVEEQATLDALYQELSETPEVLMAL
jgi:D-alanine transaminase